MLMKLTPDSIIHFRTEKLLLKWGKAFNIDYGNIDFEKVIIETVISTRI